MDVFGGLPCGSEISLAVLGPRGQKWAQGGREEVLLVRNGGTEGCAHTSYRRSPGLWEGSPAAPYFAVLSQSAARSDPGQPPSPLERPLFSRTPSPWLGLCQACQGGGAGGAAGARRCSCPLLSPVAHHDPENTLNCSFLEPPSVLEPPSPSWSSRASFSSFDTTDEGPVYCVPHEESVPENPEGEPPGGPAEVPAATGPREGEDANPCPSRAAESRETAPLVSSDSERSASSPELPAAALYARVARLACRQPGAEAEGLSPSPERRKPPPPDPSTKPKVSWIHGRYNSQQSNSLPATSRALDAAGHGLSKRKRTPSETSSGLRGPGHEPGSPRGLIKAQKPPGAPSTELPAQGPPWARERGPGSAESPDAGSQRPTPHPAPEAAGLLAAQLKEKTGSLGLGEAGARHNGLGAPQLLREKPAPPQKAKRSGLPGSRKAGPSPSPAHYKPQASSPEASAASAEPLGPEAGKPDAGRSGSQEHPGPAETPRKKTPIQKPPRKKSREASGGTERVKAATTPP
ncbi:scavenger receptor class F member 2-like [Gracilinanus agilis]|uniref:scavenger receptor class F member 2-like n=1 Tax=Gracilinanus agilis TaxID=191870 RepID=UPI001CFF524A|nr:scavenger receptor class F member 2-like [Gracilinanus agilis]